MQTGIFLFVGFLCSCLPGLSYAQSARPNIILIFMDDMGYADPSVFGNPKVKTPHLDALIQSGIRFTNFYSNSPICSPSRVALMTGQYPMRHRIHSHLASRKENHERAMADYLDSTATMLPRILKQNGYTTGHFGKWHLGGGRDVGDAPLPQAYGFDASLTSFEGLGDRVLKYKHPMSQQSEKLGKGRLVWAEKYQTTQIYVDSALAFIRRTQQKPFFLNLWPMDVHDPHESAPGKTEKYKAITQNPAEQQFFAVLEEADTQIGRFMQELEKMGILQNTIVVFTSDNGPTDWPRYYQGGMTPPGFTGPFYGRKWSLYEGGIRMPFSIVWKNHIPAGNVDQTTVVSAVDMLPSLCKLAGISLPTGYQGDGLDRSKALTGTPQKRSQPIMWEYGSATGGSLQPGNPTFVSPTLAMRDGDWKLLINADSTRAQLFNLVKDPGETTNLATKETKRAQKMATQLLAWRRSLPVAIAQAKK